MDIPAGLVASVNAGRVQPAAYASTKAGTAIDKRPLDGAVAIRTLGVDGDAQANRRHHGGPDQAVYAYAIEDLRFWADELALELPTGLGPGQFGENLTTLGVDVTNAVIGERWQVGTALLEVTSPRTPCKVFAGFLGVDRWVRRFTDHGAPGAYLRVVTEGTCGRGDHIAVVSRPSHGVTIAETFAAMTGDRSRAARLLEAPELPEKLRAKAMRWLGLDDLDAFPAG